jgi:hypothetical protein
MRIPLGRGYTMEVVDNVGLYLDVLGACYYEDLQSCRRVATSKEELAGHKWSEHEAELLTDKKRMPYIEEREKLQNNINTEVIFVSL